MISESYLLKDELAKISLSLHKKTKQKKWFQKSFLLFEKDVFISFFIIRKLFESNKLSTIYEDYEIDCLKIPTSGKGVTRYNNHKLEKLFDFSKTSTDIITLLDLCHQIVHSYVFVPTFDEEFHLEAFFVSSDYKRNKNLYYLRIDDIINLLDLLSKDYPNVATDQYDESLKDYRLIQVMVNSKEEANKFLSAVHSMDQEMLRIKSKTNKELLKVLKWMRRTKNNKNV